MSSGHKILILIKKLPRAFPTLNAFPLPFSRPTIVPTHIVWLAGGDKTVAILRGRGDYTGRRAVKKKLTFIEKLSPGRRRNGRFCSVSFPLYLSLFHLISFFLLAEVLIFLMKSQTTPELHSEKVYAGRQVTVCGVAYVPWYFRLLFLYWKPQWSGLIRFPHKINGVILYQVVFPISETFGPVQNHKLESEYTKRKRKRFVVYERTSFHMEFI